MNYEEYKTAEDAPVLAPPTPYSLDDIDDDSDEKFELSCVCDKHTSNCSLVQCEKCGYWFHKSCIFIPRGPAGEYLNFYCPFCLQQKIRCQCGDSNKYNEELIQCDQCHFHVHKKCELNQQNIHLKKFICAHCTSQNETAKDDGLLI